MWPSEHLQFLNKKKIILKPVLKWITHIAQIKILPANHPVGYGLTYITKKTTKIAVIPQGYADGLPRSLSNNGEVLIKGKKAKILGRVAMNMTVVDISNIKDAMPDDEVVILGKQACQPSQGSRRGKGEITAEQIAKESNTINYETTTRISALLPRVIK
jgi:alanine racemase